MKCKKAQENLYDLLTQRVDKRISKEIQKHIDTCTKCRAEMEDLKKTAFLLDQWEVPDVPEGFKERVRKRVEETYPGSLPLIRLQWLKNLYYPYYKIPIEAIAALLVVFLGFAVYWAIFTRPVSEYDLVSRSFGLPKSGSFIELKKAEKPILIQVEDLDASVEHITKIVEARNGEVIPPRISLKKGYLLTIALDKESEEAFLEDLSGIGKIYMEKHDYRDERGNICVIVLKNQESGS